MLTNPIEHFLIISRPKDQWEVPASIEFECTNLTEANTKCQELTVAHPEKMFKIETWTKVR